VQGKGERCWSTLSSSALHCRYVALLVRFAGGGEWTCEDFGSEDLGSEDSGSESSGDGSVADGGAEFSEGSARDATEEAGSGMLALTALEASV
jgi:hypothetical protein